MNVIQVGKRLAQRAPAKIRSLQRSVVYTWTNFRQLPSKTQAISAAALAGLLIAAVGGAIALHQPAKSPYEQVNETYTAQLSDLATSAKNLPPTIWPAKTISSDLSDYDEQLYAMQGNCNALAADYTTMKAWKLPQKTKDAMAQVQRLCDDLKGVLLYSQNLYHAAHNYLVLAPDPWPNFSDHFEFQSHLNTIAVGAKNAKSQLQNVNTTATQDPALQELTGLLDQTTSLTDKLQAAIDSNDAPTAAQLAQDTSQKVKRDQANFLNARSYFWNNTIRVEKLRNSIDTLSKLFQLPDSAGNH